MSWPDTKVPERNGRQITLVDLATHTSALPRMPSNFRPKDPENPYTDYTVEALYSFLSTYELPREIGAKFEYSKAQRFKDQKANPGSEAAIRRQIDELQRREPKFDQFTPDLAEIARPQMPHAEEQVANLGALQSMEFKGVGPGGADIYRLKFEHGLIEWRIFMDADGKIASQFWHPVPE